MMMMMMDDSGDSGVAEGDSAGRGSRGGAAVGSSSSLSVNKVSSKIGKGIRRPAPQPLTVYKTGPEGFRNLVQELTGAGASHEVSSNNARPAAPPSSKTPNNGRLQNLAPPPLMAPPAPLCSRPSFSHARPPHDFPPLLSPLSLSPLAAADNVWACNGLESPASASMRHLAQLVAGGASAEMVANQVQQQQQQQQQHSSPLCLSPTFPLSPSFPPSFTSSSSSTLAQAGYSLATVVGAVVASNSSSARAPLPPPPDFSFPGSGGS